MRTEKPKRGRKQAPPRTLVNILTKFGGTRKHYYSLVLDCHPNDVHRFLLLHFHRTKG